MKDPDGIILRSFNMHDSVLGENLKAIARAGAGTNNIPIDKCTEKGIVVFNTPGANANAVKELVLAGLFLSSRKIAQSMEWAKTLKGEGENVGKLVEKKAKSNFVGPEIEGKKSLSIIGLGAIGVMVANAAYHLGMDVIGYDPYISVDAAWGLSRHVKKAGNVKDLVAECDYITLHVPLNDSTKGMIGKDLFAIMKKRRENT
ncbi:MAG: NAD(P)-binding domain-containing protein [Clostridiales bacterium]|nr:MAG: NAD(P)-binding domain-containing protein [Clostridiales bacterium]